MLNWILPPLMCGVIDQVDGQFALVESTDQALHLVKLTHLDDPREGDAVCLRHRRRGPEAWACHGAVHHYPGDCPIRRRHVQPDHSRARSRNHPHPD